MAEVHAGLAELAEDARTAAAEWRTVVETLEPLAKVDHLPAARKTLLDRARARR